MHLEVHLYSLSSPSKGEENSYLVPANYLPLYIVI